MRWTVGSVMSIGVLGLACGDDTSVTDSGPPPTLDPTGGATSTSDPTTGGPDTDEPPAESTTTDGPADGTATETGDPSGSTGPSMTCGDDVVEGDELCDGTDLGGQTCETQGFTGGELACAADCSGYDTRACTMPVCGNGAAEGDEACDGVDLGGATCQSEGFDSGSLSCDNDCAALDTSECGTCGNVIVDGDEVCDDVALFGQTCVTQGFEHGQIACAADCQSFDTSGCGLCGDASVGGAEDCDGIDLGGATCISLGATAGVLACAPDCSFDLSGCDFPGMVYEIGAPNTSAMTSNYFRGHGYDANGNGTLIDFEVYLGLAAPCDLDFYVYEAPAFGGPYTQVQRTTVNAGPGTQHYAAGLTPVAITSGQYYVLGVAWNCLATYYYDNTGVYAGFDAGVGIYDVSHWDNSYPGASDLYVPPNTGTGTTAYVHRVTFAD